MDVCEYVKCNSGNPGAISTKHGIHTTICLEKCCRGKTPLANSVGGHVKIIEKTDIKIKD